MAKLSDTVVNGNLRVTGTLYGTGQYFVVESSDVNAFAKILDAYNKKKTIILHSYTSSTGIHLWVPLTRANVNSSGTITQFTFSKPVAYGSNIGMLEIWTIASTSTTGFAYSTANAHDSQYSDGAFRAETTDFATTCLGTAVSCTTCTGNSATAARATADSAGNVLSDTYATRTQTLSPHSWLFTNMASNYYKFNQADNSATESGTVSGYQDTHYIEYVLQTAGSGIRTANAYMLVFRGFDATSEQVIFPGRMVGGAQLPENIVYTIDVVNMGGYSIPIKVGAGGCWGSTKYAGSIFYNGNVQTIDTSDIASWSSGKRNLVTIYTLETNQHIVFEMYYFKTSVTISGTTYQNHNVYVTTLKAGAL